MKSSADELFRLALRERFPAQNISLRNEHVQNQCVQFWFTGNETIYLWFWLHGDVSLFHYDDELLLESCSDLVELTAEELLAKVSKHAAKNT